MKDSVVIDPPASLLRVTAGFKAILNLPARFIDKGQNLISNVVCLFEAGEGWPTVNAETGFALRAPDDALSCLDDLADCLDELVSTLRAGKFDPVAFKHRWFPLCLTSGSEGDNG